MFPQRNLGRLSQRAVQQTRSTPIRSTIQRRFNSAEAKPSWIVDNAFNHERAAVKHHAASTSSTYYDIQTQLMLLQTSLKQRTLNADLVIPQTSG